MKHSLAMVMITVLSISGCARDSRVFDLNPENTQIRKHIEELATVSSAPAFLNQHSLFRQALMEVTTKSGWSNQLLIDRYLDTGVAVADLLCKEHFKRLSVAQAHFNAARGVFGLTDALTAGVLGLASASTAAIAGAGLGFGAIDAAFETAEANYLVSPDIVGVESLVIEAQLQLSSDILGGSLTPKTYPAAERALAAYAHLCTFNGTKKLLNEAVEKGKEHLRQGTQSRDRLQRTAASALIDNLSALVLGEGHRLTDRQLEALYVHFYGTPDATIQKKIEDLLASGTVSGAEAMKNANDRKPSVRTLLSGISRFINLEIGADRLSKEFALAEQTQTQHEGITNAAIKSNTQPALDASQGQAASSAAVAGGNEVVSAGVEIQNALEKSGAADEKEAVKVAVDAAQSAADAAVTAANESTSETAQVAAQNAVDTANDIAKKAEANPDIQIKEIKDPLLEVLKNSANAVEKAAENPQVELPADVSASEASLNIEIE